MLMRWWNARRGRVDAQLNAAEARDELLSAYLDGELSGVEAGSLTTQLSADDGLRMSLEELRDLRTALRSLPEARAPRAFVVTAPSASVRRSRLELGAGAGAVVAAVGFVLVLGADLASGGPRSVALSDTASFVASEARESGSGARKVDDARATGQAEPVAADSGAASTAAPAAGAAPPPAPPVATSVAPQPPAAVATHAAAPSSSPVTPPPPLARSTTTSALEATAGSAAAPAAPPMLQGASPTSPTSPVAPTRTPAATPTLTVTPIVSIQPALRSTEAAAAAASAGGAQSPVPPVPSTGGGPADAPAPAATDSGESEAASKPLIVPRPAPAVSAPVLEAESLLAPSAGNEMRISVSQESGVDAARAAEVGLGALAVGLAAAAATLWYRRRQAMV